MHRDSSLVLASIGLRGCGPGSYFENTYDAADILDAEKYPVVAYPDPPFVLSPLQFLSARGPGILC